MAVNNYIPTGLNYSQKIKNSAVINWKITYKVGYFYKIYQSSSIDTGFELIQTTPINARFANIAVASGGIKFFKITSIRSSDSEESARSASLEVNFEGITENQGDRGYQTIGTSVVGAEENLVAATWVTGYAGTEAGMTVHPKSLVSIIVKSHHDSGVLTGLKMKIDVSRFSDGSNPITVLPEQEIAISGAGAEMIRDIAFYESMKIAEGMYFFIKFKADAATNAFVEVTDISYIDYVGEKIYTI